MSPVRLTRSRYFAPSLVEGALIFAVLYGLAVLTRLLHPDLGGVGLTDGALLSGGLFVLILLVSYRASAGVKVSVKRQTVVFAVASFLLGLFCFSSLQLLLSPGQRWSSLLVLEGAIAVPLTVAVWRWANFRFRILLPTRERLAILGTGESARELCRWIAERRLADYAVLGFIDDDNTRLGTIMAMGARVQSDYDGLTRYTVQSRVDRIIVSLDEKRGKLPVRQLMEARLRGVEVEEGTTFVERMSGRIPVDTMLPSWLIFSHGFKTSRRRVVCKRAADVVMSLVLLALAAPLMLVTAVLIRLESRGPILYRQGRVGLDGTEFEVLKFRSMKADAEHGTGPVWAQKYDPRVTRIGLVIRKLRIDELPQLFNVLKGEMSFVGPRPERGHFVHRLEDKLPYYTLRRTVRPGITGWAQVEYGYGATDEDALEKLKYDLFYIKNATFAFDLWIVLKTIKVVLAGHGAR